MSIFTFNGYKFKNYSEFQNLQNLAIEKDIETVEEFTKFLGVHFNTTTIK